MTQPAQHNPMPWLIIVAGSLIAVLTFGPRSAMGFFQLPMLADTGWDRSTFGLAMAVQNLSWGLGQPIFGALADRYGTGRMLALSGVLYAVGLILMATGTSIVGLYIGGGVLVGLAVAAGSFGVILSAFARNVTPQQRSFAFGIGTAAGSAGMFLFAPLSQGLISTYGWSDSLVIMAGLMLLVPLLAYPLRGNASSGTQSQAEFKQTTGEALREAFGHQSYLLLVSGFFVCGFQLVFIGTHFPAYLNDRGLGLDIGASALALIGLFNIFGSYLFGLSGDFWRRKYVLSGIYAARAVVVLLFLALPLSPLTALLFAGAMGFLWLGTVPLTSGLIGQIFGVRYLSTLYGIVFLSHQLGSFCGAWLGGYAFDRTGSYDGVWIATFLLAAAAALIHLPIRDAALPRPQPA